MLLKTKLKKHPVKTIRFKGFESSKNGRRQETRETGSISFQSDARVAKITKNKAVKTKAKIKRPKTIQIFGSKPKIKLGSSKRSFKKYIQKPKKSKNIGAKASFLR